MRKMLPPSYQHILTQNLHEYHGHPQMEKYHLSSDSSKNHIASDHRELSSYKPGHIIHKAHVRSKSYHSSYFMWFFFLIYKIHKPHKQIANEKQNAGNFTGQTEVICFKEVMLSFVFLLPNVFSTNKRAFVASGFIPNFTFCILSWKRKCTLDTSVFLFSSPSTEEENHGGCWLFVYLGFLLFCFYPHLPETRGVDFKLTQKAVKEHLGPLHKHSIFSKLGSYLGFTKVIITTALISNKVKKLRFGSDWSL